MTTVYITGATNKPSGGVKVMNQVSVLFKEKGFESFVVPADNCPQANFLDNPAACLSVEEYAKRLKVDDISIDFWPDKRLVEIAAQKKNRLRIFWQHGASIPVGGTTVGNLVFRKGNPYIQHWNVSRACAEYFHKHYGLQMPVVHPFFDSPMMKECQNKIVHSRNGFLVLARRGQRYLTMIQKQLRGKRLTLLKEPYHEREFFEALLNHTFFISIDDGIHRPSLIRQGKNFLRALLSSQERERRKKTNGWIIPQGHLLGFPMPPVEAAWLGCVTIGFAMGGGLEWMNDKNCLLAIDTNRRSLQRQINQATKMTEKEIDLIRRRAKEATNRFNQEQTWKRLKELLPL